MRQAGQRGPFRDHPFARDVADSVEQAAARPAVRRLVSEMEAELGVAVPRVVVRRVGFEQPLPGGAALLHPPRRCKDLQQVEHGAMARVQRHRLLEGGNGLVGAAGFAQDPA
jgi:hypothetical protein